MISIKSILTALGNPKQYNQLKNIKNLKLVAYDIQYKEGILEYLDKSIDINFLLLNDNLIGNLSTYELIKKIKSKNNRIKIILITDKSNNHIKVYKKISEFNNQVIINILENKVTYNSQSIPKIVEKVKNKGKIVTIMGTHGIGKSIFAALLAVSLKQKKVLLIDFNFENNSLSLLMNIKNRCKRGNIDGFLNKGLLANVVHSKYKIDLIQSKNIFNQETNENPGKIAEKIESIKNEYDLIIIDSSIIEFPNYVKEIARISNDVIILTGANALEIKKTKKILDICEEKWKLPLNKLKLIINKYNKLSIEESILKIIFKKYKIIGKIEASDIYDMAINKNEIEIKEILNNINQISEKIGGKDGNKKFTFKQSNAKHTRAIEVSK